MARKIWTQEEVKALEQYVCGKVERGVKLTAGEAVIWDVLKCGKPLEVRFVEEVDFMMSFDE